MSVSVLGCSQGAAPSHRAANRLKRKINPLIAQKQSSAKEVTTIEPEITPAQKRACLNRVIKAKREMLEMYQYEIEKLESQVANLQGVADAIQAGIVKAENTLSRIE